MRRIVVTGMGAVSPLGCSVETNWSRLLAGRSGIRTLPEAITADLSARVGGQVPDVAVDPEGGFDPDRAAPRKDQRKMDRFILFALMAADEAIAQADWKPEDARSRQRTATVIASGIGGFPAIADAVRTTDSKGIRRLSPFTVPSFLVNLAAGHISIRYGFEGAIGAPVTACAAGVQAIGDAARLIRAGEADIAICGGAEACIDRVSLGGLALDHAQARGAEPIAELIGYGTTSDAFHMTAGREDGDGAKRAMQIALQQAGISARDIQHLNAHATSTPVGDHGELEAIKTIFGTNGGVAVSSTKSATGHLLGAAGGLEAIFAILALRDQIAPETLNLDNPDLSAEGIDLVRGGARAMKIDHVLSNGFGFGGVNASLVLRKM